MRKFPLMSRHFNCMQFQNKLDTTAKYVYLSVYSLGHQERIISSLSFKF